MKDNNIEGDDTLEVWNVPGIGNTPFATEKFKHMTLSLGSKFFNVAVLCKG